MMKPKFISTVRMKFLKLRRDKEHSARLSSKVRRLRFFNLAQGGREGAGANYLRQERTKEVKLQLIIMVVLVALLVFVLYGCSSFLKGKLFGSKQQPLDSENPCFSSSDRIMIVVPHPDDETLACAGLIMRAVRKRVPILVVIMTSGDGYVKNCEIRFETVNPGAVDFRQMGMARHHETIRAMKDVGLRRKSIIFLCYPDGGTNSLFNESWDYDHLHQGLNGVTHAPYSYAYEKKAPYCGESVVRNLTRITKRFKPSLIIYPDPGDHQHDHWATSAFVQYVMCKMNYEAKQLTFLVHKGFNWPFPWAYTPSYKLLPPPEFLALDAKWTKLYLSRKEENSKRRAIGHHLSQNPLMGPFFDAFVRRNELFARYPAIRATRVTRKPDFFIRSKLPLTLFKDPKGDTLKKEFAEFGDLTAAGFALSRDSAWVALETQGGIAPQVIYAFHLRIFNRQGVRRIDIRIENGNPIAETLARNSVKIDTPIHIEIKGKRMVAQLPPHHFRKADCFLFNVDSYIHKRRIDRTAWRRVKLK